MGLVPPAIPQLISMSVSCTSKKVLCNPKGLVWAIDRRDQSSVEEAPS
jgi:hypothetical protein